MFFFNVKIRLHGALRPRPKSPNPPPRSLFRPQPHCSPPEQQMTLSPSCEIRFLIFIKHHNSLNLCWTERYDPLAASSPSIKRVVLLQQFLHVVHSQSRDCNLLVVNRTEEHLICNFAPVLPIQNQSPARTSQISGV